MNGFSRLAFVETKLFLREKAATIAVFGLPVALVIGFGLIPGFGQPQKSLSGQIGTEYIASLGVAIVLATLGLNGVPMVIGQYRERGILRRLGVTPVRPMTLLVAKLVVWAASAILSVAFVIAVVRIAFHVPTPAEPGWFALSVLLGIGSVFALGMVAAAAAPTARSAAGLGWLLFFPNMFLAGIYFPTEEMSSTMRRIGDFTPLGSALHAVRDSWMGLDPRPEYLGIMAAYAVVLGALAARFGFLHAMRYLTGAWRWVACAAVAIFFAMAQAGGFHRPTVSTVTIWVLLACVDVVLVGAFTVLGVKSEEQNQARKQMIVELAEANQRLEEIMAENTGLQAQLLTQAREAGAGDERQRMAREIHDTLAQGLTGIITQLEAARQTGSDAERERRIDNAKRLARDSLAEARRSVQALRPQALEDSKLPEALADEVARWTATSGVPAEVRTTGDPRALHPEVEVTLLRVAQEALANVAKHAAAAHAWVTLSYMEDVVTLDVRDDGSGFAQMGESQPGESQTDGGFGLIAMRQRVSRLAGQLEIESEPGAGTAVSASLPAIGLGESN